MTSLTIKSILFFRILIILKVKNEACFSLNELLITECPWQFCNDYNSIISRKGIYANSLTVILLHVSRMENQLVSLSVHCIVLSESLSTSVRLL